MTVSNNLKEAREKYDLSYADLANLTGIAKSTLQRYETGTTSKIPLDAIEKISKALGTTPQTLLGWQDDDMGDLENMEMLFGDKLKKIRLERNMSQEELAMLLGTSKQVVSRYETNQRTPKITIAQDYAGILGVPLNYLINDSVTDVQNSHPIAKDETDITTIIEQMKERLTKQNLTFEGKPVKPEDVQSILSAIQIGVEMARKQINDKK